MSKSFINLSFVIPCYGSEHTIAAVIDTIHSTMKPHTDYSYEIICVNDGSPDHVIDVLTEIAKKDPLCKVLDCAKNNGQHTAVMAGLAHAGGERIAILDDDGQSPVQNLFQMMAKMDEGYDVVWASYEDKCNGAFRAFGSWLNEKMLCIMLHKPAEIHVSNFCLMAHCIARSVSKCSVPSPYILGYILACSGRLANVKMESAPRLAGQSGYTLRKLLRLWLTGLISFSVVPLRIGTLFGFLLAVLGILGGFAVLLVKLLNPNMAAGWPSLFCVLVFGFGAVLSMLGLVGEYIGRIHLCVNRIPQYVIRNRINFPEDWKENE